MRQFQARGKAFGFVVESLVVIKKKTGCFKRLAPVHFVVRSTDDFCGKPQYSFVSQIYAPPVWMIVMIRQTVMAAVIRSVSTRTRLG